MGMCFTPPPSGQPTRCPQAGWTLVDLINRYMTVMVSAIVDHGLAQMEAFFHDMIEAGKAAGDIPAHLDPVDTARGLLTLFIGLRVLSRSRPKESLLRSVANQVGALLK